MSRLKPFPIAGGSYKDDTLPWSAQDTVNWLPVAAEKPGTTSPLLLRGVPGLQTMVGSGQSAGLPVRGGYDADGFCVVVIGQSLYRFDGKTTMLLGTIPGIQRVQFAHNQIAGGVQIAIATGTGGYVYDTAAQTLTQITDDGFPGAKSFAYMDSYIIGVDPTGNFWFNSDLADATSYNTLNRYAAESEPDRIQTLLVSHEDVVIFGARTTEFWYDSGANIGTFQRRDGTGFEIGCVSAHAAVNLDNTVYWRGHDGSAYRLNGYTAQRISTGPIEQDWAKSDPSQCFAMTFVDRGHKIVYWTQPDGKTWGYDVATGEWHRRASHLMNRWRANCLFRHQRTWYAGDYTNGRLYALDWKVNTEGGQPLVAERTTTVMQDDRNRFRLNAVEIVLDAQQSPFTIAGALRSGTVGDSVSTTYANSGGALPITYSLASGTLPAGVTLSGDKASGTYVTGGTYTFVVRSVDATGREAFVTDTVKVAESSLMKWWLVDNSIPSGTFYTSPSPASFASSETRSPFVQPLFGIQQAGGRAMFVGSTQIDTTNDFPISPNISSLVVTPPVAPNVSTSVTGLWRAGDALVCANAGTRGYAISFDGGVTWATYAGPNSNPVIAMARLPSGRWVAQTNVYGFWYSDDTGAPTNWIAATNANSTGTPGRFIFVGKAGAFCVDNLNGVRRTVDGTAWNYTASGIPGSIPTDSVTGASDGLGNHVLCTTIQNKVIVSHDDGATFSLVTVAGASSSAGPSLMNAGGGYFVLCNKNANAIFYSADAGNTWHQSTLPAGLVSPRVNYIGA